MSPRQRSRRAIWNVIRQSGGQPILMCEIARLSTYSITTVVAAVQELEQNGYIEVDRRARAANRIAPYSYRILREMEHE